jgi:5'-hydroxyaverantin dehydrogenase
VATAWAKAGAIVSVLDIYIEEKGRAIVGELGPDAAYFRCDVTDFQDQVNAFKAAIRRSPAQTLDIVATFAGTAFAAGNQVDHVLAAGEPSLEADISAPNIQNIHVNLTGTYYTSWLALYYFRLKPASGIVVPSDTSKSLIFMASIGAYMDSPKASTYPASKFGVRGLFRSTRARAMEVGVRCNLLAPWFVDTPLMAGLKNGMAGRGVQMADVLGFASMESCVAAASYVAVSHVHGRAFAIQPEGIFDLKDDLADGWAGDQLRPIMKRRFEAGFGA